MRIVPKILAVTVAALLVLGCVTLYSALLQSPHPEWFSRQMIYLVLGLISCGVLTATDYRRWKTWIVWGLYGVSIVLLILVFVPGIGVHQLGASRWIRIGGFTLQSSEVAKLALILALAAYVERHQRKMTTFKHGLFYSGLICAPVLGLIFCEVDLGTTITLGAVVAVMLLVSGVRLIQVVPIGAVALAAAVLFVATDETRRARVDALLHPEKYEESQGMQAKFAAEAFAVGGLYGVGLADSPFKNSRFVPMYYSDFIFSVVGAESGLIGSMSATLLFATFLCCGVCIAWHARDMFGMLVVIGITFFIVMQAFVHMGVVTGLLPNKGFPLPFVSHGGSNLLFNLSGVGLMFSVARRAVTRVRSKNPFESHVDNHAAAAA